MFISNKYTKTYFKIIESAKINNSLKLDIEKHHITPRSLGGNNSNENIVKLTYQEHYLVHWLLTKMCICSEHTRKMKYAMRSMAWNKDNKRYIASWRYKLARKNMIEAIKSRKISDETREKLSISGKKRFAKQSERDKMQKSKLNSEFSKHTEETKQKISKSVNKRYLDPAARLKTSITTKEAQQCPIFRAKRSELTKQRYIDRPELREKISNQFKGIPKEKFICIHCTNYYSMGNLVRWHGDNCKLRNTVSIEY